MKHLIVMDYSVGEIDIIDITPETAAEIDRRGDLEWFVLKELKYHNSDIEYMLVDSRIIVNHFSEKEYLEAINDKG